MISFRILEDNRFKSSYGNQTIIFNDDDKTKFAEMADK